MPTSSPYLTITTQPSSTATTDVAFTTQPAIQLRDGGGNALSVSGVTVTATKATGTGTLGGTTTADTNASGVATFTNLEIVGDGAHTLQFAATGYTSVTSGTVTVGSGPSNIVWAAQWRSTGTSDAALRDYNAVGGYRFDYSAGFGSVISAEGSGITGWPTANVLRVSSASGEGWCKLYTESLPTFSVGSTRYYRWYMASTLDGDTSDGQAHPIETGSLSLDQEYGMGQFFDSNVSGELVPTSWNYSIMAGADSTHYRENTGSAFNDPVIAIPQYVVYRMELAIYRTTTTQYTMQARRYNADGVLEADENDFYAPTIGVLSGRTMTLGNTGTLETWGCGSNQANWMPVGAAPQSYQAAFAISDEDWLGPYNAATEATWDQ